MKQVELRLLAGYRRHLPEKDRDKGKTVVEVVDGATLGDLLGLYGLDESRPLVVLVNGRHAPCGKVLEVGDMVSVFPPVAGG